MATQKRSEFIPFSIRVILIHFLTYTVFGLVMSNLLNYEELFQREIIRDFMLPIDSHTLLGVAVQPIRGFLFALALWPLRELFIEKKRGWLIVWSLFLVFGILSTTGAAPSSIEGALYSKLPLWYHLIGLPEISLQTLTFSYILVYWEKRQLMSAQELKQQGKKGFLSRLILPLVISSFAYIGFAVSSIGVFFLSGADLDFSSAAGDMKSQLMFVVAFLFNVVFVFLISQRWLDDKMSVWAIFGAAWALDSLILYLYQWLVFGSSSPLTVILIGFLPAAIIAFAISRNYKKEEPA